MHHDFHDTVALDPAAIPVGAEGVPDYYWPVRQDEIMHAADALVRGWVEVLREPIAAGDRDARLANIVGSALFTDFLGLIVARLLATRFERDGRRPELPATHVAHWRAAFLGESLGAGRLPQLLAKGVARPPLWHRLARPLADLRTPDVFVRRPLALADLARDTVVITVCPLVRARTAKSVGRLVYVPAYEWFYPQTTTELAARPLRPLSSAFRDRLVDRLEEVCLSLGAMPMAVPPDSFTVMLDETTAWVRFYLERLEARPDRLPQRLWKGSSGVIWSRILADAVQANGGHVTGHDHALGANYSERTLIPFNELQANDVFVTFSEAQAALYRRRMPDLLIAPKAPEIVAADAGLAVTPDRLPDLPNVPPVSVLYVTPFLAGSRIGAMPLMPAVMALDWQARLFAMLLDTGLEVSQKPHPESEFGVVPYFADHPAVRTRTERFEEIMGEFDVILFDFAPQSCFGSALNSDRPMVLIDFGTTEYEPSLRAKLEERVAVVRGSYDADNRAQVDPSDLSAAIERARHVRSGAFARAISQ